MRPHSRGAFRPGDASSPSPSRNEEGAGNAGCALHPRSRVQYARKKDAHEHTGEAEAFRHPLRNGFTAYSVLSPASEFVLSPSSAD
jgi:hypothetical protein